MTRTRFRSALALALLLGAARANAQSADDLQDVTVAPIECWTRTSARSVRVGEIFSLVLTCAVVETRSTTVVPDQSRLDPSVLQIPPFEVVGGIQARDVRTPTQRFFQYEYDVRFLGETIGVDVQMPGPTITYRVQSRVQSDAAVESREREYNLPSQTIRVVSLVPAATADIRDQAPDTFRAVEARRFRASVLRVVRWVLLGLAAISLIWAVAALVRRPKSKTAEGPVASSRAVLAAAGRELAAIGRDRQTAGWSADLAARALGALRAAASVALGRTVAQTPAAAGADASRGQLRTTAGWLRRKRMIVSGSATAEAVAQRMQQAEREGAPADPALIDLQTAMERFGVAVYGREPALDDTGLDDALEQGIRGARAVARRHTWVASLLRQLRESANGLRDRAWAR